MAATLAWQAWVTRAPRGQDGGRRSARSTTYCTRPAAAIAGTDVAGSGRSAGEGGRVRSWNRRWREMRDMREFVAQSQTQPSLPLCRQEIANTVIKGDLDSLHGILQAYHLSGISVQRRDSCSTFTFCISTAYDSVYLDSYFLDIQVQQPRKVIRHNVPAFIPVEQTARTHLQQDLAQFLDVLHKALNAYVSRRYQLEQLQECHGPYLSQIQRNAACNLLKFHYPIWCEDIEQSVLVKLVYEDPASCLPTDVSFTCSGRTAESVRQKLESHRQLFLHQHLHRALDSVKLQQELVLSRDSPLQRNTQLPTTKQGH